MKWRFLWILLIPGIVWAAGAGLSTWDSMTESAVLADGDLIGITNVSVTTGSTDGTSETLTYAQLKTNLYGSPTLVTPVIGVATGTSLALTGNLTGNVAVTVTTAATLVLTEVNTRGDLHQNGDADVIDYTLPAAAAGLSACFMAGEFTGVITIDPYDTADTIYLNGVTTTAGVSIDSPGTVGDMICLIAVDATKWYTLGQINTWVTTP